MMNGQKSFTAVYIGRYHGTRLAVLSAVDQVMKMYDKRHSHRYREASVEKVGRKTVTNRQC